MYHPHPGYVTKRLYCICWWLGLWVVIALYAQLSHCYGCSHFMWLQELSGRIADSQCQWQAQSMSLVRVIWLINEWQNRSRSFWWCSSHPNINWTDAMVIVVLAAAAAVSVWLSVRLHLQLTTHYPPCLAKPSLHRIDTNALEVTHRYITW